MAEIMPFHNLGGKTMFPYFFTLDDLVLKLHHLLIFSQSDFEVFLPFQHQEPLVPPPHMIEVR